MSRDPREVVYYTPITSSTPYSKKIVYTTRHYRYIKERAYVGKYHFYPWNAVLILGVF